MSLKELAAAAFAAVDVADDIIFDAEMKTTQALTKLRDLQLYLEAAPKTAVELVDGCLQYICTMEYVNFGSPRYIFSRAQLEEFAQTAFAAGMAHGYASEKCDPVPCEPVHDYKAESPAAAQQVTSADYYHRKGNACAGGQLGAQPGPAPAAVPIRTKESAVDLQFSDGTCVNVRVAGK